MSFTKKASLFLSCTSLGFANLDSFLFESDSTADEIIADSQKTMNPTQKKSASTTKGAHNHFFVEGEAMILSSGVNNLEFGDRVFDNNKIQGHHLSSLPRPYSVGVRVGLGAELGGIGWDLKVSGMHYSNQAKKTLNANPDQYLIYLTYSSSLNKASAVSLSGGKQAGYYDINLNLVDALMTKLLVSQKHFDFILDSGFRYLNVHQRLNIFNSNSNTAIADFFGTTNIKNSDKVSAYGLVARLHNKFKFTRLFYLDLSGAISLVYGQQKMTNSAVASSEFTPLDLVLGTSFRQYNKKLLPIAELEAKFGFKKAFYDDAFEFGITAGYFMMDLINGFTGIKIAYPSDVQTTSRFEGDTVLQGVSCGLNLRF